MSKRDELGKWIEQEKQEGLLGLHLSPAVENGHILPSFESVKKLRKTSERLMQADYGEIDEELAAEILGVVTAPAIDDPDFF